MVPFDDQLCHSSKMAATAANLDLVSKPNKKVLDGSSQIHVPRNRSFLKHIMKVTIFECFKRFIEMILNERGNWLPLDAYITLGQHYKWCCIAIGVLAVLLAGIDCSCICHFACFVALEVN
jgi:hypothetical protein